MADRSGRMQRGPWIAAAAVLAAIAIGAALVLPGNGSPGTSTERLPTSIATDSASVGLRVTSCTLDLAKKTVVATGTLTTPFAHDYGDIDLAVFPQAGQALGGGTQSNSQVQRGATKWSASMTFDSGTPAQCVVGVFGPSGTASFAGELP